LGKGFIQLLRQTKSEAIYYAFYLGEALLSIIDLCLAILCFKAQLLLQTLTTYLLLKLIDVFKQTEEALFEFCNSTSSAFDLIKV